MLLKSTLTSIGHLAMLSEPSESTLHDKCSKIIKSITELPFVECGVPRALLIAIIETNKSSIKALSLRALATVCVTGDAVKQFEEGGGIEILSDILSDRSNPEPQMREAITVLTQITAPWLRGHYDLTQLHLYLNTIIEHITGKLLTCIQLIVSYHIFRLTQSLSQRVIWQLRYTKKTSLDSITSKRNVTFYKVLRFQQVSYLERNVANCCYCARRVW